MIIQANMTKMALKMLLRLTLNIPLMILLIEIGKKYYL